MEPSFKIRSVDVVALKSNSNLHRHMYISLAKISVEKHLFFSSATIFCSCHKAYIRSRLHMFYQTWNIAHMFGKERLWPFWDPWYPSKTTHCQTVGAFVLLKNSLPYFFLWYFSPKCNKWTPLIRYWSVGDCVSSAVSFMPFWKTALHNSLFGNFWKTDKEIFPYV